MNWLSYVVKNWKSIVFRYSISLTPIGKSWSNPVINKPHLEGLKLYMPSTEYLDAGYINLKTHEIVDLEGITLLGKSRLEQMFNELNNSK